MNRHERRRLRALAQARTIGGELLGQRPKGYEETGQAMLAWLQKWLSEHGGQPYPHFALPPEEIALCASLDHVGDRLCRNDSARQLMQEFVVIGQMIGGPNAPPTVLMLQAVLELASVPVERVSLTELGIDVGGVN